MARRPTTTGNNLDVSYVNLSWNSTTTRVVRFGNGQKRDTFGGQRDPSGMGRHAYEFWKRIVNS
jgi:hypothetical protein